MFSENEWLTIETKKLNKLNQFFWIGANENNKENSEVYLKFIEKKITKIYFLHFRRGQSCSTTYMNSLHHKNVR